MRGAVSLRTGFRRLRCRWLSWRTDSPRLLSLADRYVSYENGRRVRYLDIYDNPRTVTHARYLGAWRTHRLGVNS